MRMVAYGAHSLSHIFVINWMEKIDILFVSLMSSLPHVFSHVTSFTKCFHLWPKDRREERMWHF
jgi:hypothetical protein